MNQPGAPAVKSSCPRAVWFLLVALAVTFLAVSGRSFWIDETLTGIKATQPSPSAWWSEMVREKSSDLQMPFYMLYEWAAAKVLGGSEWALRAACAPWFIAGAIVFASAFPTGDRRRLLAIALVLTSPFAWYYLDEARPYAMQLGAALMIVGSLNLLKTDGFSPSSGGEGRGEGGPSCSNWPLFTYLLALVILSGSSLLGMIWAGAALIAFPLVVPRERLLQILCHKKLWFALTIAALSILGSYYLWTLKVGARATAAVTAGWGNVLFIPYELLGFTGLGPGRLELRTTGLAAMNSFALPLGLFLVLAAIVLMAGLRNLPQNRRRSLSILLLCAAPALFILAVGVVTHFRVLGRHFAPLLAPILLLLTLGCASLWNRHSAMARLAVAAFFIASAASCLCVRFSERHAKDDYRSAAAIARAALASRQVVWWNAAETGARYYHVRLNTQTNLPTSATLLVNPAPSDLPTNRPPRLVIVSKPDIYDREAAVSSYLQTNRFRATRHFPAFTIWERSEAP